MRNLLLPLLVLMFIEAHGQSEFEKVYTQTGSLKIVEMGGGNLLAGVGGALGATGVSILDPQGNVLQSTFYHSDMVLGVASYKKRPENGFYFVTGRYSGVSCIEAGLYPAIGKMDSVGQVIQLNYYVMNDVCQALAIDLGTTSDSGVVTWGWRTNFFALRVDSDLNLVWAKHFDRHGGFQFIKELPSGDLLAGINMDTAGVAVARMDPAGNFLWCKSYIRPGGIVQDCVIENDSTFIITGFTDSLSNGNQKLFMMNLNGTGDLQWCRGYNSVFQWRADYPQRIVKTLDNNYAMIAISGGHPVLMKTNTSGDTLWTRAAGTPNYGYETADLLANSDGGYLFSGIVVGDLPDGNTGLPYIYKTDSLGHLPCSEIQAPPITISALFPSDSSFTLTYSEGATAYPVFVADTTYPPVTTYDGCTITSVQDPQISSYAKPSIRPNPNTGRFTVEFYDPLTADSFYSVYDAVGKLLFQRPLAKGQESAEIDLSRFAKGTYLVRVSDRNGVCYERVVVQ